MLNWRVPDIHITTTIIKTPFKAQFIRAIITEKTRNRLEQREIHSEHIESKFLPVEQIADFDNFRQSNSVFDIIRHFYSILAAKNLI